MKLCPTCMKSYAGREVDHAKVCEGFPPPPRPPRGGGGEITSAGYKLASSRGAFVYEPDDETGLEGHPDGNGERW